jgi:hypothetical protein
MILALNIKRVGIFAISLLFALTVALPAAISAQAPDTVCPEGDGWVKQDGKSSGNVLTLPAELYWGGSTGVVTYSVQEGGSLDLCIKGGRDAFRSDDADQGTTPKNSRRTILGLTGSGEVSMRRGKDISHVSWRYTPPTQEPQGDTFRFVKKWDGDVDQVDLDKVEVVFKVGAFEWRIGDAVVPVEPGDVLTPLSETVTGLPLNCSYESDLPNSYTVPVDENGENHVKKDRKDKRRNDHRKRGDSRQVSAAAAVNGTNGVVEGQLYELVVTNTIDCEDTKPVVPTEKEDDKKKEVAPREVTQVVAPVGAVDAGVGAVAHVAGLFASITAVGAGLVSRKLKL